MAPSFDFAISSLLCVEEEDTINSIIFNDDETVVFGVDQQQHHNKNQNKLLPLQSEECLVLMLEKELQHLVNADYSMRLRSADLDLKARNHAIDWMIKVQAIYDFGPLCEYLSINYFDRFLSAYDLPKGQAWMMQLLAVACLSLAAKLDEAETPLSIDLQVGQAKFVFEAKTIQRMELLVLSTLRWRMQAVTPFSFLDYFLSKINDEQKPLRPLIKRSVKLISSIIKGIDLLEYRPSEIAAAVSISVTAETQTVDIEKAISSLAKFVEKERVMKCIGIMDKYNNNKGRSHATSLVLSVPQSPIGVLDAACLSYNSDGTTVGSCANSSHNTPVNKRRKLNESEQ
ncbi:hypothetical protein ACFE04_013287 [Oxalis oulophora]